MAQTTEAPARPNVRMYKSEENYVAATREWADEHGKRMPAASTLHDEWVAVEKERAEKRKERGLPEQNGNGSKSKEKGEGRATTPTNKATVTSALRTALTLAESQKVTSADDLEKIRQAIQHAHYLLKREKRANTYPDVIANWNKGGGTSQPKAVAAAKRSGGRTSSTARIGGKGKGKGKGRK